MTITALDAALAAATVLPGEVPVPHGAELLSMPIDRLIPDPSNPRTRLGDLGELAASMDATGLLQPILARRHRRAGPSGPIEEYVVVAGHRRLAAARRLGWATVPTIVRRDMPDDEVLVAMLVENGQRADLDPIEQARALARLKAAEHLSDAQLASRVGMAQPTVSGRLALLHLPADEQAKVRTGATTIANATRAARIAAGTDRATDVSKGWHLSPDHDLSALAGARCRRLGHKTGRRVGGVACGQCWESVIRTDERDHLKTIAARGHCPVCTPTRTGGTQ